MLMEMQQTTDFVPVIAIDGPSASGKGTVAQRVADRLGFHYLDSGALYRLVAVAAAQRQVALDQEAALAAIARDLPVAFVGDAILLNGEDVSAEVRSEATGGNASRVAALPLVREALLQRQRDFRQAPGLVADGRDMGAVVFPDAGLKIFLTASAEVRAQRRCKQLIEKGLMANGQGDIFTQILQDIVERDQRDASRPVAPLKCYPDARMVDTTDLSIDQAVNQIIQFYSC
jgi:cytidylate kinase